MSADDSASDSGEFEDGGRSDGKEDSEFDYENSFGDSDASPSKTGEGKPGKVVQNQPYDEAVELSSSGSLDESVDTQDGRGKSPKASDGGGASGAAGDGAGAGNGLNDSDVRGDSPPKADESTGGEYPHDEADAEIPRGGGSGAGGGGGGGGGGSGSSAGSDGGRPSSDAGGAAAGRTSGTMSGGSGGEESESSSEEDDDDADRTAKAVGAYNPAEYEHLNVSSEVRELFQYIGRYKPHNIDLDTKLKCFIPDYIPAVGDIDAFIKVPRPDGKPDDLGLKVLDEPAANQSDPTVLDLRLRAISKKSNLEPMVVRSIENADKNPKEITKWINSVQELHRNKPPPQVHYTKSMPDIERLMQVWPDEVEELLKDIKLPSADMEMDLKEYAHTICSILDIPVYSSTVQSLHVLFTLFSEFKNNAHFMALQGGGGAAGPGPAGMAGMGGVAVGAGAYGAGAGTPGGGYGATTMTMSFGDSESKA